jgi:hypothetical protein
MTRTLRMAEGFALSLLIVFSINSPAYADPKEFMYSPRSGSYAESFTIDQKLLNAIVNAKSVALARGLNMGDYSHISVSFEINQIVITYFNLDGGLDSIFGEIVLTRPDYKIKSIK